MAHRPNQRKQCTQCGKEKLVELGFTKDESKEDGYRDECNRCRRAGRREERKDLAVAKRKEEAAELAAIDAKAKQRLAESLALPDPIADGIPHATNLAENLVGVFGGQKAFCEHIMSEYLNSAPGSMARQKYLLWVGQLVKFLSQEGFVQQPIETMSDEQLEEERLRQARVIKELSDLAEQSNVIDGEAQLIED